MRVVLSWGEIMDRAEVLKRWVGKDRTVYGIPRGGCAVAALVGIPVDSPEVADVIVDDLVDSGATRAHFQALYPGKPFGVLYDKSREFQGDWLVFPWEARDESTGPEHAVRRLLQHIGEDPDRDGLRDTPKRVLKALSEMTSGYAQDPAILLERRFEETADEMVVVRDVPFWSLCEHHLLPFHGHATVGYLPGARIVGLSKLARLVHCYSRRLQVQERMTGQIAAALMKELDARGAGVVVRGFHTCMGARGVGVGAPMVTSSLLGVFRQGEPRSEFLQLATRRDDGA